jgi:NAD-dependent dihydropyrimidine dehydrogenase PreA subunit
MLAIMEKITDGTAVVADLDELNALAELIINTSLCGLGQSAPNPVLSTLRFFREEYLAHIVDKRCPAKVCKALLKYTISEKCPNCGLCIKACPQQAITPNGKRTPVILDQEKCIKCGSCLDVCKLKCVELR